MFCQRGATLSSSLFPFVPSPEYSTKCRQPYPNPAAFRDRAEGALSSGMASRLFNGRSKRDRSAPPQTVAKVRDAEALFMCSSSELEFLEMFESRLRGVMAFETALWSLWLLLWLKLDLALEFKA